VQEGDVLKSELRGGGGLTKGRWKQGERSYLQALLEPMAGHGGRDRGRGRGGRFEEDQWGNGPGWWNQGFHPGVLPHPQFPHPFGFYPNQMVGLMPRM
jgi:hypothetical protein